MCARGARGGGHPTVEHRAVFADIEALQLLQVHVHVIRRHEPEEIDVIVRVEPSQLVLKRKWKAGDGEDVVLEGRRLGWHAQIAGRGQTLDTHSGVKRFIFLCNP